MVGSSSSRRSGAANRIAASATRMRQPPENSAHGRSCVFGREAQTRQNGRPRAPAPNRRRSHRAAHGCRPACGRRVSCFGLRQKLRALGIGGQHRIEQAVRAAGRFLRHRADAPARGLGDLAEIGLEPRRRISLSSVDLPAPLRPTRPMRRPAGRRADAPAKISRPAIRYGEVVDRQHSTVTQNGWPAAAGHGSRGFYRMPCGQANPLL